MKKISLIVALVLLASCSGKTDVTDNVKVEVTSGATVEVSASGTSVNVAGANVQIGENSVNVADVVKIDGNNVNVADVVKVDANGNIEAPGVKINGTNMELPAGVTVTTEENNTINVEAPGVKVTTGENGTNAEVPGVSVSPTNVKIDGLVDIDL